MSDTPPAAPPRWFPPAVLGLLLVFYAVPLALPIPLLDHDEGLHASIAQEMVERGDWVTPARLGEAFYDKPVFYFWLQALSLQTFGMTPAAVRLSGLLCAFLTALAVGRLAGNLFGRPAVWLAALFQGTLLLPLACAQVPVHDVALVLWVVLGVDCLARGDRTGAWRGGIGWDLAAGVCVGLAVLTKGLLGPLFVGLAYGGGLLLSRRVTLRQLRRAVVVLFIGGAVAAPWYVAMAARNPGYAYYYFVERHLLGFATTTQRHSEREWWYYVPLLLLGGLPWLAYLPAAACRRELEQAEDARGPAPRRLCWAWLVGGFVFLTLARAKLPTYLLPVFPPLALLAAEVWLRRARGLDAPAERRCTIWAFRLTAPLLPVLPLAVLGLPEPWRPSGAAVVVGCGLVCLCGVLPVWFWRRGAIWETVAASGLWQAGVFLLVMTQVVVPAAPQFSAEELAGALRARPGPLEVYFLEERVGSVVFYLTPEQRRGLRRPTFLRVNADEYRRRTFSDAALSVVADDEWRELNAWLVLDQAPAERVGRFQIYRAQDLKPRERP